MIADGSAERGLPLALVPLSSHLKSDARSATQHQRVLALFDRRKLSRECFAEILAAKGIDMRIRACGSFEEWVDEPAGELEERTVPTAVLLSIGSRRVSDPDVENEVKTLVSDFPSAPVIILSDVEDLCQTVKALELGARGYIPSSLGLGICVEAIRLALAGGVFVPASSVIAAHHLIASSQGSSNSLSRVLTARQAEVVEALRRGKANKLIAYELKLRESTVKVHIRNIMKRVNASNRTEAIYKINDMLTHHG